jgi:Fe2+ transport system protein FeoA
LEHVTSPDTERRLASVLGDTDACPHGHPIPDKNGNVRDEEVVPLSQFEPGQRACIVAIAEEDAKLLRNIEKWGLKPRTVVLVEGKDSDGSLELKLDGERLLLKKEIAAFLLARPVSSGEGIATAEEVPISRLVTGEWGIVRSYAGGRGMLGRCLSMGFTPGSRVKMLQNFGSGPVLVKIHDTEVALGRGIAEKIIVTRDKAA